MALLQVNTFSQALSRIITFHIILPNDAPPEMLAGNSNYDRPMKTLYLLHGFSGSTQDWLTGSLIQELALKYNLAVVMPAGENSFYLNGKGRTWIRDIYSSRASGILPEDIRTVR